MMDVQKNQTATRSARVKIIAIGMLIGLVFLMSLWFLAKQYMNESETQRLDHLKQTAEMARNTIEPILAAYREEQISKTEALNRVRDLVREMVYEDGTGKNYVFMSSYDGVMLVQPYEPEREMTNVWDLKDSYGLYIIRSLVETAESQEGSGYVSYHYNKPGSIESEEKISYVIGIPELECYIGTGQYMTDIRSSQRNYIINVTALTFTTLVLLLALVYSSMKELRKQNELLQKENFTLKQMEETLSKSEARFRKLFSVAAIPLCLYDREGRILDFNERYHQTFGYDRSDLPTLNEWWKLAYPDEEYRNWVLDTWNTAVEKAEKENEDIEPIEYLVTCKSGEVKNVIISGNSFQEYSLVTLIDITDRKWAEKQLKNSEEKYRLLVENAEEAIFVAQDGMLKFANPKTEEIVGYSIQEIVTRPFTDFIFTEDRLMVLNRHLSRMDDVNAPDNYEFRIVTSNGDVRWVDLKVVMIEWEGRNASLNFLSDITHRKIAEEDKRKLETQLRQSQKMEAIGILAGGIAHDFNNLLQAINGYTQLLIMRKTGNHSDIPNLVGIQSAVDRAAKLVKQLLLFSRKAETVRKPINLVKVIEYVQRLLERTIPRMVNIIVTHESNLWTINADPVQIEQILLNLGVNAADAMPEGGDLIIETKNVTADEIRPQASSDRFVLLKVSDTGQGMGRETVEHIFEPFYTTKEVGKGTGLGLASVYGIVQNHGGDIVCFSEVGNGTTFNIYLPAIEQTGPEADEQKGEKPAMGGTETILLVDDEKSIRDFASQALTNFGYKVLTRSNGEDALGVYREKINEIDLIVMDIGMPGMGGHRCLQEVIKIRPDAKVLIASGYPVYSHADKALKAGAAGYVAKPYRVNELLEMIRNVLDENK